MSTAKVHITKHSSDTSSTVGYAEGTLNGRKFTASWASWRPLGAIFYDTWLDATDAQLRAIAQALSDAGALPVATPPPHKSELQKES